MKLRHLIDELEHLKVMKGKDFYEKLLNFDFLVDIIDPNGYVRVDQTQSIGIYLDDIADECQIVAYVERGDKNVSVN